MLWVEDFDVPVPKGKNASDLAGPKLDEVFPVLEAGRARVSGPQAADVLAHIGWAHWLNEQAERESSDAPERNLKAALLADPKNVYANAMYGNWLMQTGGPLSEAMDHFNTAVKTGKARPWVRVMELNALVYKDEARSERSKITNDMRKNGEPIEDGFRSRIASDYDPIVCSHREMIQTLSAVPPDEAWATYLWLADKHGDEEDYDLLKREFVAAGVSEVAGKRAEAIAKFLALKRKLPDPRVSIARRTDEELRVLTQPEAAGAHKPAS
jgi:hypothetical protein